MTCSRGVAGGSSPPPTAITIARSSRIAPRAWWLRIVLVVLVDPGREGCMDRPRVQTDDGMVRSPQAPPERGGDHGGVGQALAAPRPPAFLAQHTDADLPLRDVDLDII